jgi:hypothetical protein
VSKKGCDEGRSVPVTVEYQSPVPPLTTLTVFLSDASKCPDDPPTAELTLQKSTTLLETARSFAVPVPASKLGKDGCPEGKTLSWFVCAVTKQKTTDFQGKTTDTVAATASLALEYDSQAPRAPEVTSAEGGDGALFLSWTSEPVATFVVYLRTIGPSPDGVDDPKRLCEAGPLSEPVPIDAGRPTSGGATDGGPGESAGEAGELASVKITSGTARAGSLKGLVNDQEYELFMVAVDSAGNESAESVRVRATPRAVQDFYRRYRCAGGTETGGFGCATAGPSGALLGTALLGLGVALRRRTRADRAARGRLCA